MPLLEQFAPEWRDKMVEIWRDRVRMQGAIDTGRLYRSITNTGLSATETSMSAEFRFLLYGIFVDSGRDGTKKGARGTVQARPWFWRSWEISTRVAVDAVQEAVGDRFVNAFALLE